MGWWRISNIETGCMASDPSCFKHDDLICGDLVADVMTKTIDTITDLYITEFNRKPKKRELRAALNFVIKAIRLKE